MTKIFTPSNKGKHLTRLLTTILAIALFAQPTRTMADETSSSKAYAQYINYNLIFTYGDKPSGNYVYEIDPTSTGYPKWQGLVNESTGTFRVNTVVFKPSFANVHPVSCAYWFYDFKYLSSIEGLEYLKTDKVTTMQSMFYDCTNLTELDLTSLNTGNVTNMIEMFYNCTYLKTLNLSGLNTSSVTHMRGMFKECQSLTELDLTSFNTGNVTTMEQMFYDCKALTELDLTSFNTGNVTNMEKMFYDCSALTTIYASDDFSTSKISSSTDMFKNCTSLKGHGTYDEYQASYLTADRANFNKQWGYLRTYYKVADTKHEFYGIAPITVDELKLEDNADFVTYSTFNATKASYTRTMPSNWGTLCLPFAIDATSTTGCRFYSLDKVDNDKIELTQLTGTIAAGTPILAYSSNKSIDITASNVSVVKTPSEGESADGWQLKGSFTQTDVASSNYIIANNKFWLASDLETSTTGSTVKSKGLRAWLIPGTDSGTKANSLGFSTGETTGINVIDAISNGKAEIYDIQGRRTDTLQKGLNIVKTGNSTKKIIVK